MIEGLRVVRKENKRVNMFDQWFLEFYHGDFEGMDIFTAKEWAKVSTEVQYTTYFPINNKSIRNTKKI